MKHGAGGRVFQFAAGGAVAVRLFQSVTAPRHAALPSQARRFFASNMEGSCAHSPCSWRMHGIRAVMTSPVACINMFEDFRPPFDAQDLLMRGFQSSVFASVKTKSCLEISGKFVSA